MTKTAKGISRRAGIALVATSFLWSEAAVWLSAHREALLAESAGEFLNIAGSMVIFVAVPAFLFALFYYRERWSLVAVLLLLLGPVRCDRIDHAQIARERWGAKRPALEARLPRLLLLAPKPVEGLLGVEEPEPNVRVVLSETGRRWVSFVQYRVGGDNGMAYVYDLQDSLEVEVGNVRETQPPGLGHKLSGLGVIGAIQPLGGHWYCVLFT